METTRVRIVVAGRVQGVWFRDSTRREAERLGVTGWVQNLPDGSVEAVFEGAPSAVAEAVAWAHHGPDRALVTSVQEYPEHAEGLQAFEIRAG